MTISVIAAGAAFAQTDAGSSPPPPGPAVTMQPIANPPEAAKPMAGAKGKHHGKHAMKHHKKAKKAAEAAPAPAASK